MNDAEIKKGGFTNMFPNPITSYRFAQGLSVRELAQKAQVSLRTLYRLETPTRKKTYPRLVGKVLKVLAPDNEKKRMDLAGEWLRWKSNTEIMN
jgi:hypothetical protein